MLISIFMANIVNYGFLYVNKSDGLIKKLDNMRLFRDHREWQFVELVTEEDAQHESKR